MTDATRFLHTPLGQPGSGRVRYGAAMELWRQGRISAAVLEVYRIASPHDRHDPLRMLRDEGLPLPPMPPLESPMLALYAAARDYILSLDHSGATEVRVGLPAAPGPEVAVAATPNRVVEQWLKVALTALAETHPDLAKCIGAAAGGLCWGGYDAYPPDLIGDDFATGHAFASLVGSYAPFFREDFDFGLFLIAPDLLYPDHMHPAPELYAPLTGPHGWRFGPGDPLQIKPAHAPVWNPPHQPHLTKTGPVPFLCFYVWTQDVHEAACVIPADDLALLERTAIV
jgi:hypothetical protein